MRGLGPLVAKASTNVVRKRPGRPATGQDPVTAIRLSGDMRRDLDDWRRTQDDLPSRSEAIRRLVASALAHPPMVAGKPHKGAAKAKDMAKGVINERLKHLPDDERITRKGRLLKGPAGSA